MIGSLFNCNYWLSKKLWMKVTTTYLHFLEEASIFGAKILQTGKVSRFIFICGWFSGKLWKPNEDIDFR
eukprot:c51729_g1_i1 orf=182-388(+)